MTVADDKLVGLTRPIIGIENRTAQEVFDVMCYRILRALPASGGEGAAVKPLEWKHIPSLDVWSADGGIYWAWEREGVGYWRRWHPQDNENHQVDGDGEAAKAACQADYEASILSALDRSPTVVEEEGMDHIADAGKMVADGWVLVPREPTEAMLRAGMDDLGWWCEPYQAPREGGVPVEADMDAEEAARINSMQIAVVASAFGAMIAASPSKPEQAPSPVPQAVAPAFWTLHNENQVHIGLWKDENTALKVSLEYPGCTITPLYASPLSGGDTGNGKFKRGDRVEKIKGSSWRGLVVGEYSTTLTPEGYCVESENEPGSVQLYPAGALHPFAGGDTGKVEVTDEAVRAAATEMAMALEGPFPADEAWTEYQGVAREALTAALRTLEGKRT